jgi:hypothetical protein
VPAAVRAAPSEEAAWNGLRSLDDRQLRLLAQGIVDEIRWRTIYPHRNENYVSPNHDQPRSYRGATATTRVNVPAPFQGLAQFVNRYLCNTFAFIGHGGCLDQSGFEATERELGGAAIGLRGREEVAGDQQGRRPSARDVSGVGDRGGQRQRAEVATDLRRRLGLSEGQGAGEGEQSAESHS